MQTQWSYQDPAKKPLLQLGHNISPIIGSMISGLIVVFWALRIWIGGTVFPWIGVGSSVLILGGLGLPIVSLRWPRWRRVVERILFGLAAAAFLIWIYWQVFQNPAYGTDELAFDQYAAQLWMHGINPYLVSMAPAFQQFLVPAIYHTYTLTGHEITQLSYPALSFMLYLPFLALGLHAQAAVWVDALFWLVSNALFYRLLPRDYRWIAIVSLSFVQYTNYVVGGVTDPLFLPFLLVALWRWDRFGDPALSRGQRFIGPVALGLAMAVKQTPWFFAPFLALGIAIDSAEHHRPVGRITLTYIAITATTFFVANLPFDVITPVVWLRGTLLPLIAHTVPSGQGLINFTLSAGWGGGALKWFNDAGLLLVVLALFVMGFRYPRTKALWPLMVPLLFFWTSRSFASYLIDLFPAVLIGVLSVQPTQWRPERLQRLGTILIASLSVLFAGVIGLALFTPAPLSIHVTQTISSGEFSTLQKLDVQVVNQTGNPIRPHFTINNRGYLTSFWIAKGPHIIAAHAQTTYQLLAPNTMSMPGLLSGFRVLAMSISPAAVSESPLYLPNPYSVTITPNALNHLVALHHTIVLRVDLRNRFGQRVRRPGIPVALGQIIYGQTALVAAETQINGHPEGATPVIAMTNHQGVANFRILGDQYQGVPVYFQAYVDQRDHYPYGYSNIVLINFQK